MKGKFLTHITQLTNLSISFYSVFSHLKNGVPIWKRKEQYILLFPEGFKNKKAEMDEKRWQVKNKKGKIFMDNKGNQDSET